MPETLKPQHPKTSEPSTPEQRILALRICDLACGSGHFLIAAAHRIAKRLAFVRTGEEEPVPEALRHALRDVIGHCIYGVDINPMAVELCKVALWMEALEPGKPLSFLDHHIQCGNSLLGTTPALLARGIPDDAFTAIEGDVKPRVAELKKQNKREREDYLNRQGYLFDPPMKLGNMAADFARLNSAPDGTLADVAAIQDRYAQLVRGNDYQFGRLLADTWCAAFVWKKDDSADGKLCPTERDFRKVETHAATGLLPHVRAEVQRLRDQYQFFHLHLAFPDVFRLPGKDETPENELTGWSGGFDVVLGNPPWERVKLQEKEWFAQRVPEIANLSSASARSKQIAALEQSNPLLHAQYLATLRHGEGENMLLRDSQRFSLVRGGDINTFAVFTELSFDAIAPKGRSGLIVPSGIVTSLAYQEFFARIVENFHLVSVFDFENRGGFFLEVDSRYRFCLLTLAGKNPNPAMLAFFLHDVEELHDPEKCFAIRNSDLALLNPNTKTCPVFYTRRDAELVRGIHERVPVLVNDMTPQNPWGIAIYRMIDANENSEGLRAEGELRATGSEPGCDWTFTAQDETWLRVYEGKMIDAFNHRFASSYTVEGGQRTGRSDTTSESDLHAANYAVKPRYWVAENTVRTKMANWSHQWLIAFMDVCSATNERTMIPAIIPLTGATKSLRIVREAKCSSESMLGLVANWASFVFDYVVRQSVAGLHLSEHIVKQLPVLPPSTYSEPCPWTGPLQTAITHEQFLLPRVLELTYTAWDLEPFARDCGYAGPPFRWDEERRFLLRAELDAAFFHLYALHRDDTAYILDTFPIVRRKDEQKFNGEYKTKTTILSIYDEMAKSIETGQPYQTRLNPPPADPRVAHPDTRVTKRKPSSKRLEQGERVLLLKLLLEQSNQPLDRDALERGIVLALTTTAHQRIASQQPVSPACTQPSEVKNYWPGLDRQLAALVKNDVIGVETRAGQQLFTLKDRMGLDSTLADKYRPLVIDAVRWSGRLKDQRELALFLTEADCEELETVLG